MLRLLTASTAVLLLAACGGGKVTCPASGSTGACAGSSAEWCDGSATTPTTLDCATLATGGTCATVTGLGAWCAAPVGQKCLVTGHEARGAVLSCGTGACDADLGCVAATATCTPSSSFAATCQGDLLVTDCTAWGEPVVKSCTGSAVKGTGCSAGACVGVPAGSACSAKVQCAAGLSCNASGVCDAFTPASHPALPQVPNAGGHVLTTPKLQMITWSTDPQTAAIDGATQEWTTSAFWGQTTAEYGVGALTVLPRKVLAGSPAAKMTDAKVQALLKQHLGADWGAPDPSTIYMVSIPDGVSFDDGSGSKCCQDYDGYHYEMSVGSVTVPFSIVCVCPGFDGPTETDAQQLTVVIAHEAVEAATDPFPNSDPAYANSDDDHAIWTVVTGGELADMCAFVAGANMTPTGSTYMVQRSWSNAAAKAGLDPCVPSTGPFCSAVPVMPATGSIDYNGAWTTQVVKAAVGQSVTIDVPVFSSAAMADATVKVYDLNSDYFGSTKLLNVSLDRSTAHNGDVLKLTIDPIQFDSTLKAAGFVIETTWDGGGSLAMGVVVAP
jgi:hypothetical protein